jgi:hypothetical protein
MNKYLTKEGRTYLPIFLPKWVGWYLTYVCKHLFMYLPKYLQSNIKFLKKNLMPRGIFTLGHMS